MLGRFGWKCYIAGVKGFLTPQSCGGSERNIMSLAVSRLFQEPVKKFIYWRFTGKRYVNPKTLSENRKPLWDYLASHNCKNILEIGLGGGENAKKILSLTPDCNYYCFDILNEPLVMRAFAGLQRRRNVHFYIGDSRETLPLALSELPMMDGIFIDGGHGHGTVKRDWENCKRLMHDNTACFFHDCELLGVWRVVGRIGDEFSVVIIDPGVGPLFALVRRKKP